MRTFTNWRRIPTPPEKFGAAASRILVGTPALPPDLVRASRKTNGGAAERLVYYRAYIIIMKIMHIFI